MPSSCPRMLAVLAVALSFVLSIGCAEERKPINKVQPNALAKTFFIGDPGNPNDDPTFYWRNFVVDASESQELVGVGSWSAVDRIRWDVTETMLYARRAYNQNTGADLSGTTSSNGTIVAAYPILSHFDIKRDYNPQTGEQLNVIVENTTDRPWYQRDYFRVDWSVNQVDTPDWSDMFIGKLAGELKLTNVAYYVSDPTSDDAPHFEPDSGYFDVTSKFTVEPTDSSEVPGLPQCALLGFLTGTAIENCDGQEAVVRSSYWRVDQVDPDGDFEPFENTKAALDIIGNPGGLGDSLESGVVTPPRVSWDPGYGYVDPNMTKLMQIHNVWKQSHQVRGSCKADADCSRYGSGSSCLPSGSCTVPCDYKAPADTNTNGTDDQCENKNTGYKGSQGSECSFRNRCTIPYRDRETKPVAFWVNSDMPGSLQDQVDGSGNVTAGGPTEDVVHTWNQAVDLAVAHARELECRRTNSGDRTKCHSLYFDTKNPIEMVSFGGWGIERVKTPESIVVTCHNPVRDYDPDVCGAKNATARIGDLRHHFINYWQYASRAPWGGIANWNADPLTGQIIGAAATIMGRSVTGASAQIRDILMVKNGELQLTDITDGVPATLYEQKLRLGDKQTAMPATEIARRTSAVDMTHLGQAFGLTLSGATAADRLAQMRQLKLSTTSDPGMLSAAVAVTDGIAKPLLGSSYEAQLISPGWLVDAQGLDPTTQVDDSALNSVSPLRGMDPMRLSIASQTALAQMNSHGVCMMAGADSVGNPDIQGVGPWFGNPNGMFRDEVVLKQFPSIQATDTASISEKRGDLIYQYLIGDVFKGIALHEVGHALGMLHNFASSYDAVNYMPQYWQLRTNEGKSTQSCNGTPRPDGADSCMGPRYLDPETDDELGQADEPRPGINYFANTTTMEYQNERFFENSGLGTYDVMTMGALYGRLLETFDQDATDGVRLTTQKNFEPLAESQLSENDDVNQTTIRGSGVQPMHYTELAREIKLYDASRCRAATPAEATQAEWRIVHGKVCTPPPKDHAAWNDFLDGIKNDGSGPRTIVSGTATAAANEVRWPYRNGELQNAYIHVNPSDAGADPYEVVQETIRKFDYQYPFTYFRRQRRDWDYYGIPSQTALNFFERLRSDHWVVDFDLANEQAANTPDVFAQLKATDDVVRGNLLASTEMFDAISKTLLVPEIGSFRGADPSIQIGATRLIYDADQGNGGGATFGNAFTLDASQARYIDPSYDSGPAAGGSWDYSNWTIRAGFDVEKAMAALALADGRPTLEIIRRDTWLDGRDLYVNFRTDLGKGMDRLMGGILASDWDSVSPYVTSTTTPTAPQVTPLTDDVPVRPATATLLYPDVGYQQQLAALIFGQVYSRLGTDLTLANKMLIYLEGTVNVISIPDAQQIKFSDPRSGFTYVARLYGPDAIDGKAVDQGIGSRMLARANQLLAFAYQVVLDAGGKPVLDQYGRPTLVLGPDGQPLPVTDATATKAFSDYVGLVDASVQVSTLIGHGPN